MARHDPNCCPACGHRVSGFAAGCSVCGADLDPARARRSAARWHRRRAMRAAGISTLLAVPMLVLLLWGNGFSGGEPGLLRQAPGAEPAGAPAPPEREPAPADARAVAALAERGTPAARQRAALERYLRDRGATAKGTAAVLRHTVDGIALRPGGRDARSRFGGRALLPEGEDWPSASGELMTFVGVFDLADLPPVGDLPRTGRLSLFYDNASYEFDIERAGRVFHLPPGAGAREVSPPSDTGPIRPRPLRGTVTPYPGAAREVIDEVGEDEALIDAMNDLTGTGIYPAHLLGASLDVQGPALEEMEHAVPVAPDRWVLLAQIEELDDFTVGDAGALYYGIRAGDLRARRFDRVVTVMQSH